MKKNAFLSAAASGLILSALAVISAPAAVAERGDKEVSRLARIATSAAQKAQKALDAKKMSVAVAHAERAVAAMPRSADYRYLLGEAYLADGRFTSAQSAFSDALTLKPDHDKAILKLALVKASMGKRQDARDLLEANRSLLTNADYGLALALAGDPATAATTLEETIRGGEATPKIRQNLALAYALSGRWAEARAMASFDVPADQVSRRMEEWAVIARADNSWDQVASVLGVAPREDEGVPMALALNADPLLVDPSAAPGEAAAQLASVDAPSMEAPVSVQDVPAEVKDPAPVRMADAVDSTSPNGPSSQASAPAAGPAAAPVSVAADFAKEAPSAIAPRATKRGGYAVQLGAYRTPKGAAAGWSHVSKRWSMLRGLDGRQAHVTLANGAFYRLSVGGFASRGEATRLCSSIKWDGGSCFVRSLTSADTVRWAATTSTGKQQLAAR